MVSDYNKWPYMNVYGYNGKQYKNEVRNDKEVAEERTKRYTDYVAALLE